MTGIVSVYALFGSAEEAQMICRAMVEEKLAACANILAPCKSIYRWEDKIETASEVPVLLKTRADIAQALIDRIDQLHSYEVPAAVAWAVDAALPAYLTWVEEVTRPTPATGD